MTAWLAVACLAFALALSAFWNVRLLGEVQRLTEARHAGSRPRSAEAAARPGTSLVTPAEAAAHANAMHTISAPYVPVHDRTVQPRRTPDSPPWEDPGAVAAEQLQQQRADRARRRLLELPAGADTGEMRAYMAGLMDELGAMGPVYGQAPQLAIEAAGQEGRMAS